MSRKDQRQALARLRAEGIVVAIEQGRKHLKLRLCNGSTYIAATTPGQGCATANMVAGIRREARR